MKLTVRKKGDGKAVESVPSAATVKTHSQEAANKTLGLPRELTLNLAISKVMNSAGAVSKLAPKPAGSKSVVGTPPRGLLQTLKPGGRAG